MDAIVIAAGEGRRLRPITERWPKPVLPIDGRPVIATLVRQLMDEGLGQITVVTGYLGGQVEELLSGLDLRYAAQPSPRRLPGRRPPRARGRSCAPGPRLRRGHGVLSRRPGRGGQRRRRRRDRGAGGRAERPHRGRGRARSAGRQPRCDASAVVCAALAPDRPHRPRESARSAVRARGRVSACDRRGKADSGGRDRPDADLTEPADLVLENFPYLGG